MKNDPVVDFARLYTVIYSKLNASHSLAKDLIQLDVLDGCVRASVYSVNRSLFAHKFKPKQANKA